ncbi:Fe-S metabolism protein SufE, partial [Oleiphilus sp. HI0132]
EFLDDWEERYAYIIDLGKSLPAFPEAEKTELNLVHGCQSQVWLVHYFDEASNKLFFLIESDAIIVKGLASVVLATLNARSPAEIVAKDVEAIFNDMDLMRHISPTRGNGLRSMLERMKNIAGNF